MNEEETNTFAEDDYYSDLAEKDHENKMKYKRQMNDEINAVENHYKHKDVTTTTVSDPRRWELKKLIHNMIDEDFNLWYEEIMSWKIGERVKTAQEIINEGYESGKKKIS